MSAAGETDAALAAITHRCEVQNRLIKAGVALMGAMVGIVYGESIENRSARRTDARDLYATARELYDAEFGSGERGVLR